MNVITLKLPDELNDALRKASEQRKLSKSAVVREALEQALLHQADEAGAAERWVAQWRGSMTVAPPVKGKTGGASPTKRPEPASGDPRLRHLLDKHVR